MSVYTVRQVHKFSLTLGSSRLAPTKLMTKGLFSLESMATSRQNMSTSDLQPKEEARYLSIKTTCQSTQCVNQKPVTSKTLSIMVSTHGEEDSEDIV